MGQSKAVLFVGSMLAGMIHLVREGRLATEGAAGPESVYRLG